MDKKSIYIILAVAVIAAGIWFWLNAPAEKTPLQGVADDTASISQDLNNINVQEPDFNAIDSGVDSL